MKDKDKNVKPRTTGRIVSMDTEPTGPFAEEATKILKARWLKACSETEKAKSKPEKLPPNRICYAETAFKDWRPGMRLPRCHRCGETLHPEENHKCEGFVPKYRELTQEDHENWEARREAIRESRKELQGVFCSECGGLMECPEDAQWHWENHEGRPERNHHAIDGEPDGDLDGYEDEPEEDWCDEDSDPDLE